MDPLVSYLRDGTLPLNPKDVNRIEKKAQWFTLYEGILYKKAFAHPLLRCTTPDEGRKILEEIHEGECGRTSEEEPWQPKPCEQGTIG